MSGKTKIEWCDKTWNPVTGCTKISEGCRNCYAARMAKRLAGRCGYSATDPFKVTLHEDKLGYPKTIEKPSRIFVNSMGDLFHEGVPRSIIDNVFLAMHKNNQHTYLILTKRAFRMWGYISSFRKRDSGFYHRSDRETWGFSEWPLPNVWLGVTAENQEMADERIPLLLETPAAVRFVSIEPMLGPVNLWRWLPDSPSETLDWVICGGETGPGARPMHPDWVRSLRDQCQAAEVPFFFKGWGDWTPEPDLVFNRRGVVTLDGEYIDSRSVGIIEALKDKSAARVCKSGKKWSGRMLDGREWNEFPDVNPPFPPSRRGA